MSIGTLSHVHFIQELGIRFQQVISYPPPPVAESCCGDFDDDHEHELRERLSETRRIAYSEANECE